MIDVSSSGMLGGHMVVRAESDGLAAARAWIRDVAYELNLSEDQATDLLIAAGEAISNAYLYGTPNPAENFIYLDWCYDGGVLSITIRDEGKGFSSSKQVRKHHCPTVFRGNGIELMRCSVDEVYLNDCGGASVTLKKRTPLTVCI